MIKLSDYEEISVFNESTVLVRLNGVKYVKKTVPKELTRIYKIIKETDHKNIAGIIGLYEYEDVTVVIEEYIAGKTLAKILEQEGKLSEHSVKRVVGQICDGLFFLHKHNIIHRDINPNNIMIADDGCAKIIDFDISRSVKKHSCADTAVLGTVGYAAPEQFGFSQSDERTDIYAVGVLANVMLTGKLPSDRIYEGRLGDVIKKAVSIDAKARYKSIISFKHAFLNRPDENTPLPMRALRTVPGFRTWVWWKMLLAVIFYGTYCPLSVVFVTWSKSFGMAMVTVVAEVFMFAVPFLLMTNISGVRKRLSRNPAAAFAEAAAVSAVSFVLGACIFLANTGNI